MSQSRSQFSVVIASYRRPASLRRCVQGLLTQNCPALEIIVAHREDDLETAEVVADLGPGVTEVTVRAPGVLPPLHAAAARASGDVIAFIDDDAVARPDWLDRLGMWFDDPALGGVGGRDLIHDSSGSVQRRPTSDVGRITPFGRLIANHHRGVGAAREVDVLKGVNAAFRRRALALPATLHGVGAQPHWEVATCLWARRQGWRLVYDPTICVDHFPAHRPSGDARQRPPGHVIEDMAYNYVAALLSIEPGLFWRRGLYGLLLGGGGDPGVIRAIVALMARDWDIVRRLPPCLAGQIKAMIDVASGRRVEMVPVT